MLYGGFYAGGSQSEAQHGTKQSQVCSSKTKNEWKTELESSVKTNVPLSQLQAICDPGRLTCTYDPDALQISVRFNPEDPKTKAFFQAPQTEGSLRIHKQHPIKVGSQVGFSSGAGGGTPIALQVVPGKENLLGKVTLPFKIGHTLASASVMDSCTVKQSAQVVVRQFITGGAPDMKSAVTVNPTFSRTHSNDNPMKVEYEWFAFTVPQDGEVNAKLFARDDSLRLRVHTGQQFDAVAGNYTDVQAGLTREVTFSVKGGQKYTVGIQLLNRPTGGQLDVSYLSK